MGNTLTEKIIAKHSEKKEVLPGEFVQVKVDFCLSNDITSPLAIKQFNQLGKKVFDKNKIAIVLDHFVPNKDILSAEQSKFVRDFAKQHKIKYFYDCGKAGIEHALLPEQGLILPAEIVIGADSHTCTYGALGCFSTGVGSTDMAGVWLTGKIWLKVPQTIKFNYYGKLNKYVYGKDLILWTIGKIGVDGANYKAMEFSGEVIKYLEMNERFSMCNMAIEAGAKNGIIQPDIITFRYLNSLPFLKKELNVRIFERLKSDTDVKYSEIIDIDCSKIYPLVALPHLPSNVQQVDQLNNIYIDQVVIGSCTNGWIEDLRIAAKILKNKKVNSNIRVLIFPATPTIYQEALKEGIIEIFIDAGAVVCPPTCGPCLGGHLGILAKGERCLATTNRNFVGRMGDVESEVYLSNPAVAAASAIKGRIAVPEEK